MIGDEMLVREHHLFDLKYRLGGMQGGAIAAATLLRLAPSPILVVAPHSVAHRRAGRAKAAEFWTGALAETLGSMLGASVLTALSPRVEEHSSASADDFLAVFDLVARSRSLQLVLDVHGLAARHAIDVNIGTADLGRPDLVASLADELGRSYRVSVDRPFRGRRSIAALVNRDRESPTVALQLEFGARLRSDTTPLADLLAVAEALEGLAKAVGAG